MRFARWCLVAVVTMLVIDQQAFAHCDTLTGPVIAAARIALKTGDATPVLRWVEGRFEPEVRKALDRAITVRAKGPEATALADQWFFETVVRQHRQGEGLPFVGLRDEPAEPMLALADAAIAEGSLDRMKKAVTDGVVSTLDARFREVLETKKHADESVEAGRRFVAAYVEFIHFIETLRPSAGESH